MDGVTETFRPGDRVVRRSKREDRGVIGGDSRRLGGENWYPVIFPGGTEQVLADDLESCRGEMSIEALLADGVFASNTALTRRITAAKLSRPLRDAIYSLYASRTEFHPHQYKPLLKFVSSDRPRILIADEVGLGKTIEAGYILQEQKARYDIDRILVVCPASLRQKWEGELWRRFGQRFDVLDSKGVRRHLQQAENANGPRQSLHGIVSLESVRSDSVLGLLEDRPPELDLLIVDEAHHCRNSETRQHRAVKALAFAAEAVAFLTATPLHLGNEDLFNLLRLLLPEEFDRLDVFNDRLSVNEHIVRAEAHLRRTDELGPSLALQSLVSVEGTAERRRFLENPLYVEAKEGLTACEAGDVQKIVELQDTLSRLNLLSHVMTRTKKRDAYPNAAQRKPQVLIVEMTVQEREVYDAIYGYCAQRYTEAHGDVAAQFALITLERQLASSIPAMLEHYRDALQNAGMPTDIEDGIESGDEVSAADEKENGQSNPSASGSLLLDSEFVTLIRQFLAGDGVKKDSRFEKLYDVLRSTDDKVVLFATFRRSLAYLERCLTEKGIKCVRVDGSVHSDPFNPEKDLRGQLVSQFREDPETRVLLSSQVLREGHDLQFCSTLINWDLPWNPMDVEQRIGRLDRLGQKSEQILVFNFSVPGTVESRILQRLYTRVGLFEGAIGPLEPILGELIKELTEKLFNYRLSDEDREREIERTALVLQRRLRDEQELENAAAGLLGHDQIFEEQLDRVRRLGRYVTPREVELLLKDFLAQEYSDATLRNAKECRWLKVTPGLREFIRRMLPVNDPALLRFLERAYSGEVRITFDSSVAMADLGAELIHGQHPLIKAIARFYADTPERIPPVAAVLVESTDVPEGDYFFVWAGVNETGLQAGRSVWVDIVAGDGALRLTPDQAEVLLHQMVLHGRHWNDFASPPGDFNLALFVNCQDALATRVLERKAEAIRQNRARVEARIASLKASTDAKRREKQRLLDSHRLHGRANAIRLIEAQIRKLEADYEQKLSELEKGRAVAVSFQEEGAGFVRVNAPIGVA